MTEDLKIKDLILLEKNPRKITKDQMQKLCDSLESDPDFLKKRPILVNKVEGTYHVYAGNQRIRAAKKLKWKTVPCLIDENLDEKTVKQRIIKDNQGFGEFDYDMLANEWDIDLLLAAGMTEDQLSYDPIETIDGEDEDQQTLSPGDDKEAQTKLGDTYDLISQPSDSGCLLCHRVFCGNSTDIDVVERLLNGGGHSATPSISIADPPYNVGYKYNNDTNDSKTINEYQDFINDFTGTALGFSDLLIVTPGKLNHRKYLPSLIYDEAVWYKSNACTYGKIFHILTLEPILFLGSKPKSKKYSRDFFDIPQRQQQDVGNHTCPKPLELWRELILPMTDEKDAVLEMFLGSGTAIIACEQLKRNCYGIELSPAYCDIVVERWVKYMKKNNKQFKIKRNGEAVQWQADQNQI